LPWREQRGHDQPSCERAAERAAKRAERGADREGSPRLARVLPGARRFSLGSASQRPLGVGEGPGFRGLPASLGELLVQPGAELIGLALGLAVGLLGHGQHRV
jgi:hypothetical protein